MPLLPTSSDTEPALYYRHWPAEQPRATVLAQAGARLIEHGPTDFPLVVIGHSRGATAATVIADETLAAIDGLVISGGPLASWEPEGEHLLNDVAHVLVARDIVEFVLGIQK
ncbi:hypothetical protein [Williamsia soli]|uniref:hypothetical protein n=1 Tax=Williamsia soli TaxID=364929 RepID=UPI001A9DF40C|nr:hypothetical protein [Williamsia soli]